MSRFYTHAEVPKMKEKQKDLSTYYKHTKTHRVYRAPYYKYVFNFDFYATSYTKYTHAWFAYP